MYNIYSLAFITLFACSHDCFSETAIPESNTPPKIEYKVSDKKATKETVVLFDNLVKIADKGVIVGQQAAYTQRMGENGASYNKVSDIEKVTGEVPLLNGQDLAFVTDDKLKSGNWYDKQADIIRESVIKSHEFGVLTSFSWHFREPYKGEDFYVKEMDQSDPTLKMKAFKSIMEGGENHDYYCDKLDIIAKFFKSLKDKDGDLIPVVFRPFHEMGGSWFWWGVPHYATAEEYKELWRFTAEYLRKKKKVHNLLFAYSPDKDFSTEEVFMEFYPGDEYVDIIGFDSYWDFSQGDHILKGLINQYKLVDSIAQDRGKVFAHTECGYDLAKPKLNNLFMDYFYKAISESGAKVSFTMFWNNKASTMFTPIEGSEQDIKDDFKRFFKDELIITQGDEFNLFFDK